MRLGKSKSPRPVVTRCLTEFSLPALIAGALVLSALLWAAILLVL